MKTLLRCGTNKSIGEGSGNNYAYLVSDSKTKEAVIIDPAHPQEYVYCPAKILRKELRS